MAGTLRDLKVWQEVVALAGEVIRSIRQNSRRETKVVSDQVMSTAISTASLIAEGHGQFLPLDQRECFHAARRELLRLETQLAVARHAELLPAPALAALTQRIHSVSRLVGGFLVYLERQVASSADEPAAGAGAVTSGS